VPRPRTSQPVSPDAALFGERLKELREKRHLTLRDLAERAQMSLTYVSDLERGQKVPSLTTLVRLAIALDCRVTTLVSGFDKRDLRAMFTT
jgi:transcriptional regulator with XRE-family HTH domain